MASVVAAPAAPVLNVLFNALILTTDLLYIDLVGNSTFSLHRLFNAVGDEDPFYAPTPPSFQRKKPNAPLTFVDGFNPELSSIDLSKIATNKLKYVEQAESAFEEVEYLLSQPGWKETKSKSDVTVKSLFFPKYAKNVMLLEAPVEIEPQKLLEELWVNGRKTPEWNADVVVARTLEDIADNMRIGYQVSAPVGGGAIAARDFLVVSIRKKIGDSYYIVYESITNYELDPKNEEFVRAINHPSGFVMQPRYNEKGELRTQFKWVLNMDMILPSMVPSAIVDKMMPLSMIKYIKQLRDHIETLV